MTPQMGRAPWDDEQLDLEWSERFGLLRGWAIATVIVVALITVPLALGGLLIQALGL
jgi:hypothetical protein